MRQHAENRTIGQQPIEIIRKTRTIAITAWVRGILPKLRSDQEYQSKLWYSESSLAWVAQLVEHSIEARRVSSSNLLPSTIKTADRRFLYVCGRLLMSSIGADLELRSAVFVELRELDFEHAVLFLCFGFVNRYFLRQEEGS